MTSRRSIPKGYRPSDAEAPAEPVPEEPVVTGEVPVQEPEETPVQEDPAPAEVPDEVPVFAPAEPHGKKAHGRAVPVPDAPRAPAGPDVDRRARLAEVLSDVPRSDIPTLVKYVHRDTGNEWAVILDLPKRALEEAWRRYDGNDGEQFLADVVASLPRGRPKVYRAVAELRLRR